MMNAYNLPELQLMHIAYVSDDITAGKQAISNMYGVTRFSDSSGVTVQVPPGELVMDFSVADCGGFQVEVIRPRGGNDWVYRDYLQGGASMPFHHFASAIANDADWERVVSAARDHRIPTPILGEYSGVKYIYLDLRTTAGHYIEYIYDPGWTPLGSGCC